MKSLRKLCTAAVTAILGFTTVIVVPLAAAGPASATIPPGPATCTPDPGFDNCLRYPMTGGPQSFTVPSGPVAIRAKVWGAGGAGNAQQGSSLPTAGGGGGFTVGTIAVTTGQILRVTVGHGGSIADTSDVFVGGGAGGSGGVDSGAGSSGGGMSAVSLQVPGDNGPPTPIVIAGGGGGAGANTAEPGDFSANAGGGGGGGTTGLDLATPDTWGSGGTQSAGGAGATSLVTGCDTAATDGSILQGGAGGAGTGSLTLGGGGGGGGYYGGGGGSCRISGSDIGVGGGGGGGSAYVAPTGVFNASTTPGDSSTGPSVTSESGGQNDSHYVSGVGTSDGGSDGHDGDIVLEWNSDPVTPAPDNATSEGVGTATQSPTITVPAGGMLRLLDGLTPTTSLTVTGEGSYSVDTSTNVVSFTPVDGFSGYATPVNFQVSNSSVQYGNAVYTAHITAPPGPTPTPLTSSGIGTAGQSQTATIPSGGSVSLLDGSTETNTVTVNGEGSYSLDPMTGVISFAPILGFSGTASALTYEVKDNYGTPGTSTYTPSVTKPAGPIPTALTSSGVGTAGQSQTATIPPSGSVTLLNGVTPTNTITLSGEGTYTLNTSTGVISFAPLLGFSGVGSALTYRVTDAYGDSASATYTPTVTKPAGPTAPADPHSSLAFNTGGSLTVPVPVGGSIALLNPSSADTFVSQQGGTWTLNELTGVITFAHGVNQTGAAGSASYRLTDAYGSNVTGAYTVTMRSPAPPVALPLTSTGRAGAIEHQQVTVPVGGSLTLLDGSTPVSTLTIASQGTFTAGPTTGLLTFTPVANFTGNVTPVTYRFTNQYSFHADNSYTVTVTPYGTAIATAPALTKLSPNHDAIPVTCKLTAGVIHRCDVVLTYRLNNVDYTVGGGFTIVGGVGSAQPITVTTRLTPLGHYLAAGLSGITVKAAISVKQTGNPTNLAATTVTRFVNATVNAPQAVYFAESSAGIQPAGIASLNQLRTRLADIKSVTCFGNTDLGTNALSGYLMAYARAANVCNYLLRGTRIAKVIVSNSWTAPQGSNSTPAGRALNRRVDIKLSY